MESLAYCRYEKKINEIVELMQINKLFGKMLFSIYSIQFINVLTL